MEHEDRLIDHKEASALLDFKSPKTIREGKRGSRHLRKIYEGPHVVRWSLAQIKEHRRNQLLKGQCKTISIGTDKKEIGECASVFAELETSTRKGERFK